MSDYSWRFVSSLLFCQYASCLLWPTHIFILDCNFPELVPLLIVCYQCFYLFSLGDFLCSKVYLYTLSSFTFISVCLILTFLWFYLFSFSLYPSPLSLYIWYIDVFYFYGYGCVSECELMHRCEVYREARRRHQIFCS